MTHSIHPLETILEVSESTYKEIKDKILKHGYADQIHEHDGSELINMHGIGFRTSRQSPVTSHRGTSGQKI